MTQPIDPQVQAARISEIFKGFFPKGEIGSFVNGAIIAGSGADQYLTDPATGKIFASFKDADQSIINAAMDSASRAQKNGCR